MNKDIVVITGAGSGLGASLAVKMSELGKHVFLLGRTKEKLERTATLLSDEYSIETVDITSKSNVRKTFQKIIHDFGKIDYLVNNAGAGIFKFTDEITEDEVDLMIDTNLKGTIYCTQEVLETMKDKNAGCILNIVSASGQVAKETESVYSASKFGVRGFLEALSLELKETNIKVVSAYMGNMQTDLWKNVEPENNYMAPDDVAEIILDNLKERPNTTVTDITIMNQ